VAIPQLWPEMGESPVPENVPSRQPGEQRLETATTRLTEPDCSTRGRRGEEGAAGCSKRLYPDRHPTLRVMSFSSTRLSAFGSTKRPELHFRTLLAGGSTQRLELIKVLGRRHGAGRFR
jgi:hypothetical protein